ncbi:hypothetical protein Tco_0680965 [Tanacetum coccineum]|uniref:Uncharacterized protein n=1 Tax=Tanacetum coccineum TaxID=301880 RepID=A0ABQ4XMU2_9ASTR
MARSGTDLKMAKLSDIDGFYTGGELPGMVPVGCMTYFQDHKWYNELDDGKLKVEALMHKAKVKESWGDATPRENYSQGRYANAKTERAYDPYLDINRIFGRNYGADNASNTQDNQEHKKEHHDLSSRTRMIKYSFDVAIKEHECSDHSKTNIDTCQAYRELFRIMDDGWLVTKSCDE